MDIRLINPFLLAAMHVLKTMAEIDAKPGKPSLREDVPGPGDVSAIIGITGDAQGSMALIFTAQCIMGISSYLLGEDFTQSELEVRDTAGELTNMICGDARRRLAEQGLILQAGRPSIAEGKGRSIMHVADGSRVAVPFETSHGSFRVEVAFSKSI
jgi:chemotaxis protein CheX